MRSLILLGGGGHAAVVCESARLAGWTVSGYLDDADTDDLARAVGLKHLGPINQLLTAIRAEHQPCVHAAVGDAELRRVWLGFAEGRPAPPIVHPSAVVSPTAQMGDGVFIGPRAVVNARVRLGRGVIVNSGAIIEHDCVIGDFSHVAPGSVLAGNVTVGDMTLIGAGAAVIPGVSIGSRCTVGAGAVVIRDIHNDHKALGVPALATAIRQGT